MKKSKWAILIIVSIIIIFVAGILLYIFVGENEDTKATQKEVEGITSTILDEIDTKLNSEENVPEQDINPDEKQEADSSNTEGKIIEGGIAEKQEENIDDKEKRILKVYDSAFYELQNSANGIVDGLVAGIKSDYSTLKAQNEASFDKLMKLGASYTKRANALEGQVDSSVSVVLDKMENDMNAQGISSDKIKAYRQAYEAEYSRQKEARRNAIMSKAQEML